MSKTGRFGNPYRKDRFKRKKSDLGKHSPCRLLGPEKTKTSPTRAHLAAPVAAGDVVVADACGTGVDVVATKSVP
ncbi:DUF1667 domain-containing protein [Gordonibacter pamelaeae]|uniref:DUF1667 domain-containing protein n=1 Tax=Gordonibacter pamelaeae TaxID=471189 RepID=UPI0022B244DA|nr:DUF1667 domain-containing protein [Gordonibacter pamelaeae]